MSIICIFFFFKYFVIFFKNGTDVHLWPNSVKSKQSTEILRQKTSVPTTGISQELHTLLIICMCVCVCNQWTGTRACKRLDDRSLDKIACSIVFIIFYYYVYYYIGRSVKILGFPAGDSRTHVSEAVVYATLNVVKYDVFPRALGMMYR